MKFNLFFFFFFLFPLQLHKKNKKKPQKTHISIFSSVSFYSGKFLFCSVQTIHIYEKYAQQKMYYISNFFLSIKINLREHWVYVRTSQI